MYRSKVNILAVSIVFTSFVLDVHTFDGYKRSNALALSSVYDMTKHNIPYSRNRNTFLYDLRNKRQTIPNRTKYYDKFITAPGNE